MMRQQNGYFLILLCGILNSLAQKNIGDSCTLRSSLKQGICKLATDCPEIDELAKQGITPTRCGFQYTTVLIVCCEVKFLAQPNENSFLDEDNAGSFVFPDSTKKPIPQKIKNLSEEKCKEYSKSVMGVVNVVPLITDPEEVSIDIVKCDNNGIPLIVGGTPAAPREFPFMAAIGYNSEDGIGWYCGGTLISYSYVVTAAHCANTKQYGPPVKVRLGELDFKTDDDGSEYADYDIAEIKIHENYKPPLRYNDIALLRLSPSVQITPFIRPACLWTQFSIKYDTGIATGWGRTGVVEEPSDKLLKVPLGILDNSVCTKRYPFHNRTLPDGIRPTMLCAGELKGGKDTCQGDSGGPLIVNKQGNRCISYIIGITSFGKGCGGPHLPAVYTRISHFVPWIEKIIW